MPRAARAHASVRARAAPTTSPGPARWNEMSGPHGRPGIRGFVVSRSARLSMVLAAVLVLGGLAAIRVVGDRGQRRMAGATTTKARRADRLKPWIPQVNPV